MLRNCSWILQGLCSNRLIIRYLLLITFNKLNHIIFKIDIFNKGTVIYI